MNFADLKERLLESLNNIWSKIQESDSYILLNEKYHTLAPPVQKVIQICVFLLVGYIVYSIPASFVDSAKTYEESFQANRDLIRGLFRSARNPTISPEQFTGPDYEQLKSLIDAQLLNAKVIDSQKGEFSTSNKPLASSQVPHAIQQIGITFEVKKLNLSQMVQLSQGLSSMHANTKLAAVDVIADREDPHYFNVKYTLSSLSLPIKEDKPNKKR